ncbi:MAG: type I DNA topoisomerase [Bacteroidota bacterium]
MAKNLLIVESPAKAKTIEKYLGKEFTVKASYGHVRDLPKGDGAIDVDNGFEPKYEILPDKKSVINELKQLIKKAETVWLATDEDREGEAISWHLAYALGLNLDTTQRIVFNEITKKAIQEAIQRPRRIDQNLVHAQQARRVLDRLVGFELSPILWRKVKTGLSAGRVQSVAVRLIVDRERDIMEFTPTPFYRINADFALERDTLLKAAYPKRLSSRGDTENFLDSCVGATYTVSGLETKPAKKSPSAPFTTSTLQQEASRKLGFSVAQTMRVAQSLYEAGKITYMRTDSVNLSTQAQEQAAKVVASTFGKEFVFTRQFRTKNSNAQEAHEAIRPTDLSLTEVDGDRNETRLYELIWKRAIASQMADARLERTTVTIDISTNQEQLKAKGEVITFEGFLKVYLESRDEDGGEDEYGDMLPPLKKGQVLKLDEMVGLERFTRPQARYTEASLVKKLEELGIGRPSTYAPTISTIQKRNYVVKETREGTPREYIKLTLKQDKVSAQTLTEMTGAEKAKLFPSDLGMVVNDFLVKYFPSILDFSFTAKVEEEFDEIAGGKKTWNEMIAGFYDDFAPHAKHIKETADRQAGERDLGVDPKSGRKVIARLGRYGPMIQIGSSDEEEKPRYAKLRSNQRLETITLEEGLELFKLPRVLGEFEETPVKANIGRFGPYVQLGKLFASLEKTDDPYTITLDRAIELIKLKREKDANKIIKHFNDECQILRGRWGPYLKIQGNNVKLPKDVAPENLTLEDCERLLEEHKTKPKKGGRKKKAGGKK